MKIKLTILSILISLACFGQGKKPIKLGIGQVEPYSVCCKEVYKEDFDSIYFDKELTKPVPGDKVWPFFYKPDYSLFTLICLDSGDNYYHILFSDSAEGYVHKSTFKFISWENIILGSTGLRRSGDNHNPLRKAPNNNADTINYPCRWRGKVEDLFSVVDIKQVGDTYWAKVAYPKNCESALYTGEEIETFPTGWIIWRKGDELYVDIAVLC